MVSWTGGTGRPSAQWKLEQDGRAGRPWVMDRLKRSRQRWAILTATVIWGLAVAIGFLALQLHGASSGQSGSAVEHWPRRSRIPLTTGRPTLIVAVHPLCACTRASVWELTHVLTRCEAQVEVYIFIFRPEHSGHGWGRQMACAVSARCPVFICWAIPRAKKRPASVPAPPALLHYTLRMGDSFSAAGSPVPGAIEGDNDGRRALLGLIEGNTSSNPRETPVFGCPIFPASFHLCWRSHAMEEVNFKSIRPRPVRRLCRDGPRNFSSSTDETSIGRPIACSRGFSRSSGWRRS